MHIILSTKTVLFRLECTKVSQRSLFNFEYCAVRKSIPEIRIEIEMNEMNRNRNRNVTFIDKCVIEILRRTCFRPRFMLFYSFSRLQ